MVLHAFLHESVDGCAVVQLIDHNKADAGNRRQGDDAGQQHGVGGRAADDAPQQRPRPDAGHQCHKGK
jgi:hypothetical protein